MTLLSKISSIQDYFSGYSAFIRKPEEEGLDYTDDDYLGLEASVTVPLQDSPNDDVAEESQGVTGPIHYPPLEDGEEPLGM